MRRKYRPRKHNANEVVKAEKGTEVLPGNQDYKMFNEHLDRMDATINDSEKLIESRTYEIGAGSLVVSLTVLSLLRDTEHFPAWGMIPTAIIWCLFTLCIILHYWSQFISKHSAEKMSEIIHQKIRQNEKYDDEKLNTIQKRIFKTVSIINKIIPRMLIFGIIVLMAFTIYCFFRV